MASDFSVSIKSFKHTFHYDLVTGTRRYLDQGLQQKNQKVQFESSPKRKNSQKKHLEDAANRGEQRDRLKSMQRFSLSIVLD